MHFETMFVLPTTCITDPRIQHRLMHTRIGWPVQGRGLRVCRKFQSLDCEDRMKRRYMYETVHPSTGAAELEYGCFRLHHDVLRMGDGVWRTRGLCGSERRYGED